MAIYKLITGPFTYQFTPQFTQRQNSAFFTGGQFQPMFSEQFSKQQIGHGSLGGATFQVASRKAVIRHHNVPTLKHTIGHFTSMQVFRANVSRYRDTSPGDKATWEAERTNYPRSNSKRPFYYSNRYHLFISSNQNLTYTLQDQILQIAPFQGWPQLTITDYLLSPNISLFNLTWNTPTMPAGSVLQLFTSRILPPGSNAETRATLRLTKIFSPGDPLTGSIANDFASVWNLSPADPGSIVFIGWQAVPGTTGQKPPMVGITLVTS